MAGGRRILLVPVALLVVALVTVAVRPVRRDRAERRDVAQPTEGVVRGGRPAADPARPAAGLAAEAAQARSQARVRGAVTGGMGALWGARVVAYAMDSEQVLADAYTNPKGEYSLAIDASTEFDIAVEPDEATYLATVRRRGIVLSPGDDRVENFALGPAATIRGRLVDQNGLGRGGIELLAVRPDDLSPDPAAHPRAVRGREVGRCRAGADGGFRLACLVGGQVAIVVRDPGWTLVSSAGVATDGPDVTLVVVPAFSVDLEVRDIETGELIDTFSVKVTTGDLRPRQLFDMLLTIAPPRAEERVVVEGRGSGGLFSGRVPGEPQPTFPEVRKLEIKADGFVPWGPRGVTPRTMVTAWLLPVRDKNTTIRVSFDDGQPYHGNMRVTFKAKSGEREGDTRFERVGDGRFRGAMPHGLWVLAIWPETIFGVPRSEAGAEVTAGADADINFVFPAGGTIIVQPPSRAGLHCVQVQAADEADQQGLSAFGVYEARPGGTRIEGIPAGLYRVGSYDVGRAHLCDEVPDVVWLREVRVTVGGVEEIALPE